MSITIRKIALAVASAIASLGAQAAPVDINFQSLTVNSTSGPVDVAGKVTGFAFSNATAWTNPVVSAKAGSGNLDTPPGEDTNVFISSLKSATTQGSNVLVRSIEVSVAGKDIDSLTFDSWFGGGGGSFTVYGYETGVPGVEHSVKSLTAGIGLKPWSTLQVADFTSLGKVDTIEFRSTSDVYFALDNLSFTFAGTTDPTVPEPASYGLVALALLAAGAASHRRKA